VLLVVGVGVGRWADLGQTAALGLELK
jgi:hypothetical protein